MFGGLGVQELLVVFLIVLLLFGAKRIPEIAQGLGKGIRDFKKAMKDTTDEVSKPTPYNENTTKNDSTDKKE
jgi:sec-independent protein translocase protein TatA